MLILTLLIITGVSALPLQEEEEAKLFLNQWTLHIPKGIQAANEIAQENGLINLGEIIPNTGYFHMETPSIPKKHHEPSNHIQEKLMEHPHIKMVEQHVVKKGITKRLLLDYDHNEVVLKTNP